MLTANKCKLYPSDEQSTVMSKTLGCSRYIYNLFLDVWNTTYEYTGQGVSFYSCCASLTELKQVLFWLKEADSTALQSALRNLSDAFNAFFKKIIRFCRTVIADNEIGIVEEALHLLEACTDGPYVILKVNIDNIAEEFKPAVLLLLNEDNE